MSAISATAPTGDVPTFSSLDERKQEISTMYEGYKAGFPEVMPAIHIYGDYVACCSNAPGSPTISCCQDMVLISYAPSALLPAKLLRS